MDHSKRIQAELSPKLGDGYDHPTAIDDVLYAFPGHLDKLLPPYDSIPEEFKRGTNEWSQFVSSWFYTGWPEDRDLYTRPDVDEEMAFRHVHTILRSFEPKHEHKMAGTAWLMSRWFSEVVKK